MKRADQWAGLFLVATMCLACGSDTEGEEEIPGPSPDASVPNNTADGGSNPGTTATLSGVVTRSTDPKAGGVGDLYLGVFKNDPVTAQNGAESVGVLKLENVDMSSASAAIAYSIEGIPTRSEPYFVTAFLDDNDNAAATGQKPDMGDLVTLDGFGSPSVVIDGDTEFEIDLNLALPI